MKTSVYRIDLGTSIRAARTKQGLSQHSLSSMIGTSKSHLWKIESGKVGVSIDTLVKIAEGLDMKVSALISF